MKLCPVCDDEWTMNRLRLLILTVVCGGMWAIAEGLPEPDKTLEALLAGNQRFIAANCARPNQTTARRLEVAQAQHPVAAVLACSDSRVPPELLFDQGLGDLFVIRLAGNIPDDAAMGSLEYAAEHLGVRLAVVLGHKRCGAVDAAVKSGHAPGHIQALVDAILPAVAASKGMPGDAVDNAVKMNVSQVSAKLRAAAPILSEMVQEHRLKIVGAYYDLDNGKVTVLP
jgi:carbonic anhydrase